MEYFYNTYPKLWSKYGFRDGFNKKSKKEVWYSKECIGIDKGISLMMIENYLTGVLWKNTMNNKYKQKGLELLKIQQKEKVYL